MTPMALAGLAGISFFAFAYAVGHFHTPVGDDTYFYVGAIRAAGRSGLADAHISARPAYPLIAATLSSILRTSPWAAAVALPMALAAGAGLGGAAFVARWGAGGWRLGAVAALMSVSVIVARLVAGRSENLLTIWFLVAAMALAAWGSGKLGPLVVGVFLFFAGLTEWPFLAAFLVTLGLATASARMLQRRNEGHRGAGESDLAPLAVAGVVAGALVALIVFAWNETGLGDAIQRLPPAATFRTRLFIELRLAWVVPTAGLVLISLVAARRRREPSLRPVVWLLTVWLGLTTLVLLAGVAGLPQPTYRALTVCVPAALGIAAAPLAWPSLTASLPRSQLGRTAVVGVLVLFALLPPFMMWYRGFTPRTTPAELGQIVDAGRYVAGLERSSKVVLVLDHPDVLRAFLYQRVVEAVVPTVFRDRILVLPGTVEDALAGHPTLRGDATSRRVIQGLFDRVRPWLERGAPVLAARSFDASAFVAARRTGERVIGDVAIARGPAPGVALAGVAPEPLLPLPPWWGMMLTAAGMLLLLEVAGFGWARLTLRRAGFAVQAALGPAFGAGVLAVATLLAVKAGLAPWEIGGILAFAFSLVAGLAALGLSVLHDTP